MKIPTGEDIKRLVQHWLQKAMEMSDDGRVLFGPYDENIQQEELEGLDSNEERLREALGARNYSFMEGPAKMLLDEEGFELDPQSTEFRRLCRDLVRAHISLIQVERKRAKGEFDEDLPAIPTPDVPFTPPTLQPVKESLPHQSGVIISVLYAEYENEMLAGGRWREKTRKANEAMMDRLVEVIGDQDVATMGKAEGRHFKTEFQKYPVNRRKDKRYRDRSLAQIRALPKVDSVSVTTVNNTLIKASGMFNWAVNQGYTSVNPFEKLNIKTAGRVKDQVLPWDREDLEKIFNAPLYRDNEYKLPYQFWLPLLGLFTGARIEEL